LPDCPAFRSLNVAYERLERLYAEAVIQLDQKRASVGAFDYQLLRRVADESRVEAETARMKLDSHKRTHH